MAQLMPASSGQSTAEAPVCLRHRMRDASCHPLPASKNRAGVAGWTIMCSMGRETWTKPTQLSCKQWPAQSIERATVKPHQQRVAGKNIACIGSLGSGRHCLYKPGRGRTNVQCAEAIPPALHGSSKWHIVSGCSATPRETGQFSCWVSLLPSPPPTTTPHAAGGTVGLACMNGAGRCAAQSQVGETTGLHMSPHHTERRGGLGGPLHQTRVLGFTRPIHRLTSGKARRVYRIEAPPLRAGSCVGES